MILGIDPGPTESAYALVDGDYNILAADKLPNEQVIYLLGEMSFSYAAVESLQCYGMPVGKETFETAYMIGRIVQRCHDLNHPATLIPRPEYMRAILGCRAPSGKADSTLWQALRLRFGGDRKGEPLYLLKGASDKRSAFAVAVYRMDVMRGGGSS